MRAHAASQRSPIQCDALRESLVDDDFVRQRAQNAKRRRRALSRTGGPGRWLRARNVGRTGIRQTSRDQPDAGGPEVVGIDHRQQVLVDAGWLHALVGVRIQSRTHREAGRREEPHRRRVRAGHRGETLGDLRFGRRRIRRAVDVPWQDYIE